MTAPDGRAPATTDATTDGPSAAEFEALRALARALLRAQEEERGRVAHDLHERVAQDLTALRLGLSATAEPVDAADRARLRALAAGLLVEVQRLAHDLNPTHVGTLGLEAALRACARELRARGAPVVDVRVALPEPMAPVDATLLFRIAQEALTNVAHHARATRASVVIEAAGDAVDLVVEDDGVGFDPEGLAPDERTGLTAMRERVVGAGGRWALVAVPGAGCRVHARLPVR
jgi:signal transduction histidine kinase